MIAVTGASGLVGRALCAHLQAQGLRHRALARADYLSPAAYAGCTSVIHLAALAHRRGPDVLQLKAVNRDLAIGAARAAAQAGARRFVFVSSSKALADAAGDDAPLDEQHPCSPPDAYGQAKFEAEQALLALHGEGLIEVCVLRPALVVGAPAKANLLSLARSAAGLAAGLWGWLFDALCAPRSFTSLGNLCSALLASSQHPAAGGQIFHVVDEPALSVGQLHRRMRACKARGPAPAAGSGRNGPSPGGPQPVHEVVRNGGALRRALLRTALTLVGRPATYTVLARPLVLDGRLIQRRLGWQPSPLLDQELIKIMETLPPRKDRPEGSLPLQ